MDSGISTRPAAWLTRASTAALRAVEARGEAFTSDLTKDVPMLAKRLRFGVGSRFEATQSVGSRVLPQLAMERRLVRGRPRGTWVNGQYRWVPMESWLNGGVPELETADAQAELLRLWLAAFGPATETDIRWWTGWTAREARAALAIGAARRRRPRRRNRIRARRRSRARRASGAHCRPPPHARPHDDGLEGAGLVPRPSRSGALRLERQRRPDRVVGRQGRRWLVAAARRRDRVPAPRGRRQGRSACGRDRGRARCGVARRQALLARLPAAVPARAGGRAEGEASLAPTTTTRRAAGRSPWRSRAAGSARFPRRSGRASRRA